MNRLPTILAFSLVVLSLPARADEAAPAPAPAPAAPAASATLPAPGRPRPGFESLPPAEKEHVRKMAEFRKRRDAAERELIALSAETDKRKEAILAENEEARKLHDRIEELKAEFIAATNSLETIYREDGKLSEIAEKIAPLQKVVEESQASLNHEVATAMQLRLSAQRAAWEKGHPAPKPPEEAPADGAEKPAEAAPAAPASPIPGLPAPRLSPAAPRVVPAAPAAPAAPAREAGSVPGASAPGSTPAN